MCLSLKKDDNCCFPLVCISLLLCHLPLLGSERANTRKCCQQSLGDLFLLQIKIVAFSKDPTPRPYHAPRGHQQFVIFGGGVGIAIEVIVPFVGCARWFWRQESFLDRMLKSCRLMEAKRSDRSHFSGSGIDIIDAWDLAYHGSLWVPDQGFCRASCGCCVVCWLQFPARTRRDVNVGKAEKLPHAKIRAPLSTTLSSVPLSC